MAITSSCAVADSCCVYPTTNREREEVEYSFTRMDPFPDDPCNGQITRFPDKPQWDQPEYSCPFCPQVEQFKPHEGRGRDRHLRETHRRLIVWSCPYCPMRKASTSFDDLRTHVRAMHWRGQHLHPPTPTLERLDWREERESRRRAHDDDQESTRTRRGDRRACSPRSNPPRKTAKRTSPAASSLGSIGASP